MASVILDVDTGEDDALALLLALKKQLPLRLVVTSFGNTSIDHSTRNSAAVLALVPDTHVPVLRGSETSMVPHPIEAETVSAGDFVGKNGLCNIELPVPGTAVIEAPGHEELPARLAERIRALSPVDYIVTGPATNLARTLELLGSAASEHIRRVFMMGGAVETPGNTGPRDANGAQLAEFNFYCDPAATQAVLESGIPLTLVSWDITQFVTVPYARIAQFQSSSPAGTFTIELMQRFYEIYGLSHDRAFELNDPLTILAYLGRGQTVKRKIRVVTEGQEAGRSVTDDAGFEVDYFVLDESERERAIEEILTALTIENAAA